MSSFILHAGEGCSDGGDTFDLSGSTEGAGAGGRDFGWYFESGGMMPPFVDATLQNGKGRGGEESRRTHSSSFTTGLLGRAPPFWSQYVIRSGLQCIVLCS